jgi:hypothetical protein
MYLDNNIDYIYYSFNESKKSNFFYIYRGRERERERKSGGERPKSSHFVKLERN